MLSPLSDSVKNPTRLLFSTALLACVSCGGPEQGPADGSLPSSGGSESAGGMPGTGGAPAGQAWTGGSNSQGASGGSGGATGGSAEATGGAVTSGGPFSAGGSSASGGDQSGSGGAGSGGVPEGTGGSGAPSEITVWVAGDSTVANGNTPCPRGWGGVLDPLFVDGVTVRNAAVGGRSVRTWLHFVQSEMGADGECLMDLDTQGVPLVQDRWQTMLDEMGEGDFLLIQFGINDGSPTCDRHVGLDAFKASYRQMAQAATDRGAQAVFLTPVSAISCQGSVARGTRGGFVTATIEVGADMGVPVIDLHQLSVDLYTDKGFCPLPGGQSDVDASTTGEVGSFFCDDHTHFDQTGAVAIAELIAQALRDQGILLAEYLQ